MTFSFLKSGEEPAIFQLTCLEVNYHTRCHFHKLKESFGFPSFIFIHVAQKSLQLFVIILCVYFIVLTV